MYEAGLGSDTNLSQSLLLMLESSSHTPGLFRLTGLENDAWRFAGDES